MITIILIDLYLPVVTRKCLVKKILNIANHMTATQSIKTQLCMRISSHPLGQVTSVTNTRQGERRFGLSQVTSHKTLSEHVARTALPQDQVHRKVDEKEGEGDAGEIEARCYGLALRHDEEGSVREEDGEAWLHRHI